MMGRLADCFEQVLNVAGVREANINVLVGNWRMPVLGDLNERAISLEEVGEAVNEMKSGKAPGLDGFPVKCLKKGGMAALEYLVRPLKVMSSMARSLPVENLLPQNVGSVINYLQ